MRKDGAYVKKTRINQILKYMLRNKTANNKVMVDKVRLYAEMEIGLSEKRAREYINKICDLYEYEIKGDWIVLKK